MQIALGLLAPEEADRLRQAAERSDMFIEAIIGLPASDRELEQFDAEMQTAARCGAHAARTVIMPGRRYEFFDSLEQYREFASRGRRALERSVPAAEKYRLPIAVENHKDQRIEERVALLQGISSEYVGACVDTGNSIALLEDPLETVTALAPWAHSVHLKDQALRSYDEGFLLADIPLGEGYLDLQQLVRIVRQKKPEMRFSLELITRDPLPVPVLTEKYWVTFPDLPARDLARMLRTVRQQPPRKLQYVSHLPLERQVAVEDANVQASLTYARRQLGL